MYYLYHVNGLNYIEMRDGMSFGRNSGTKNFPEDHKMSGEHCRFKVSGDNVYVEDLNSKNKTSLDRIQLLPNKPTQIYLLAVLEIGQQRFILTDHNLNLEEVNEILSGKHSHKTSPRIDGAKILQEKQNRLVLELDQLQESHQKLNAQLIEKKFKLADAKKSIISLAKDTDLELKRLEEEKAKILSSIVTKEDQLQMTIKTLTKDTETLTTQLEKLREDIEIKKKKAHK